jgi:geranylgeranyl diphosphate synthase type I
MSAPGDSFPLTNHRARLAQYLSNVTFSPATVAGRIIEERPVHHLRNPVRPALVLWACEARDGDPADAVPVAAAFDLFDRFLLLHEELTRDCPTVARWGLGQSLNAGDALYALAFRSLAADVVNPARRLHAARLVGEAVLEAIACDSDDAQRAAVLTGGALQCGAVIGGASDRAAHAFLEAGRLLASDPYAALTPIRRYATAGALSELESVVAYLAQRVA